MKVILFNPRSSRMRKPILPSSLLAVGALLEDRFSYRIIDGNLEVDPAGVIEAEIKSERETVLAVTVMPGPQLRETVPLCRSLKDRHPHLTIAWGGYFPSQHWQPCLRSRFVDYVVRGHGEKVFLHLLEELSAGRSIKKLPGIAFREGDTAKPVSGGMAPVPDPQDLPEFPYHRLDVNRYARKTFLGKRTFSYHSSYGCPFFCNFCAVVNLVQGSWRAQSAERTAAAAHRFVREWGADAIEFHDNNFFVSERRVAEFSERILPLRLGWWGESRIDTLLGFSDQTWELLRRAGLKMVFLGAESGSDEVLRRMDKGGTATTEKTLRVAEKSRAHDIIPEFSFVLGNPPEPEEDVDTTLRFIRRLKKVNPWSEIVLYLYTPVPLSGSLYEEAKASGFEFPSTLEEWVRPSWTDFSKRRSSRIPWVSDPLRLRLRNFERILNAYYPTRTDPRLTRSRRWLLRSLSAWRYHSGIYHFPVELRLLHRVFHYQRPETSGF